jgi:hypothetical protein
MKLEDPVPREGDDSPPVPPSPYKRLTVFEVAGRVLAAIVIVTVLGVALVLGLGAGVLALSWLMDIWPW